MTGICEGRIVIVTGAGNGLGKSYALAFAREGAKVVVNDLGVSLAGEGRDTAAAQKVVDEIKAFGGEAVANGDDVADWEGAGRIIKTAVDTFGGLDVVVNNAGIVRDRMFVSCTVEEWDAVLRVHLRGHFCVGSHAVAFWRAENKAGRPVDARIINTSSGAGLQGSIGQSAYASAKGGIASLTLVQAAELGRYNITSNALAPAARTRMTEGAFADKMKKPGMASTSRIPTTSPQPWCGWAARSRRASPAWSSTSRVAASPSRTAGWMARPSIRAPSGNRANLPPR
jgi:NAD(P)-dependent dehydrogenase (short-subunit alcohol dehydrogenase family)